MNRIFICVLVFLSIFGGISAQIGKNPSKKAKEHIQFGEYEQAIPVLADLLKDDPNSAYYNYWMGKSLFLTYRKNQALNYFEKVKELQPDVDEEFHYYYGLTLHYNLEFDKAIEAYKSDLERYKPNSKEYQWVNNRISQCVYARKLSEKRDASKVQVENMGSKINSRYAEHSPVISANDSILIYTARRPDSKGARPEEGFYDEDIYVSFKKGNSWTEGKNIGEPINEKGHDATISLSADGKTLYLYRHKKDGGLFVTKFDPEGKKWREPKQLSKPLKSKYWEASICVSEDGLTGFFSSDRPGGMGGQDLYKVTRKKENSDNWSDPENLGPRINTPFDEDAPYFHPDGKTLYYSCNGSNSQGGFDIFVTELDSSGNWLPPLNMGAPLNTPDDDIYFVLDQTGTSGYYSSGKEGGFGEKDIYHVKFPYFPYPRRFSIVELEGFVLDKQEMDTLNTYVSLVETKTGNVLDSMPSSPGEPFYFVLESNTDYTLKTGPNGYYPVEDLFTSPELGEEDILIQRNLLVAKPAGEDPPVVTGTENLPELEHLYFDFDQYNLRERSKQELERVAAILQQNPDLDLEVLGHTDYYGTSTYNQRLSENRANAALKYLKSLGTRPNQLMTNGLSENQPISTNENDDGRQWNRRVEFRLVKNDAIVLASNRLRTGSEAPFVDHTRPKGQPGYDDPTVVVDNPESGGAEIGSAGTDWTANTSGSNNTGSSAPNELDGLAIHHIYFDFDGSGLRDRSVNELEKLHSLMENHPEYELEIRGHTDNYGSVDYNQRLSQNRCQSAYSYLAGQGISRNRLSTSGFSELQPIQTNATGSGRQMNRRVEFVIKANGKALLQSSPWKPDSRY